MRALAVLPLALSVVLLGLAIVGLRREGRVRPGFDIVRLVVAVGTALLVGAAMAVDTPGGLMVGAAVAGVIAGGLQGASMQVRLTTGGAFARRGTLAVGAWAIGTVLMQVAGIANRANGVEIGLAASFFSAGMTLGLLLGRSRAITQARAQVAAVPAAVIVIAIALAPVLLAPPEPAEAAQPPECPPAIDGVSFDASTTEVKPPRDRIYGQVLCGYQNTPAVGGYAQIALNWSDSPMFVQCPAPEPSPPDDPPLVTRRVYHDSVRVWGHWSVYVDDHSSSGQISAGSTEAAFNQVYDALASLALPCDTPEPMNDGSVPACPERVAGFVRSSVHSSPGAVGASVTCSYSLPVDDSESNPFVVINGVYYTSRENRGSNCGPPATPAGDTLLASTDKDAWVKVSADGGPGPGEIQQVAEEYLAALEGVAISCGAAEERTALPPGESNLGPAKNDLDTSASGEEDDVDPSSALGGTLIALLGSIAMAGTALAERGISLAEVREAFRRKGRAGVAELLGRRTIDVALTGDEARAVLSAGIGQDIRIPEDQQWQVFVQAGEETAREGHRGVWGRIRGIPVVVENAETGEISISVDVDVIDGEIEVPEGLESPQPDAPATPPAPPPAPPGDTFTPEQIDKALDKGLDDIARLGEAPPAPPVPGGVTVGAIDVDNDGAPEAVGFDTDGDGKLDTVWMPGRGAMRPGDPGWDETVPGGKPIAEPPVEPPAPEAPPEPEPLQGAAAGGGLDVVDGPAAAGARAAADAAATLPKAEQPQAPKLHGSRAAETGTSDDLDDPTLDGGATVWHEDYLDWLKRVEEANPEATPQQVLTRLHDVQYHDDHSKGTIPGTSVKAFEQGPDTDGWQEVKLPTQHAPQFVLGPNGERIHIGHTYAGVRSDFNRGDQSDARRDFMRWFNTHGGDSAQEVIMPAVDVWEAGDALLDQRLPDALKELDHAASADWATPDQRRGNTVGTRLSDFYRDQKNRDVPVSEAMRQIFRDLAVDPLDREGQ